jgi:ribosomal protein S18 acetylase RimI-like enzyme
MMTTPEVRRALRPPASGPAAFGRMLRSMTEPVVTIRSAERRDLPTLGTFGAGLLRTHYEFDRLRFLAPSPDSEQGYAWFLGTQITRDDVCVVVAERAGRVVGYVYAGIEPMSWKELREECGFIHDVFVDEAARGTGIAVALLEAATAWFAARGMPRVVLWAAARNEQARRLFERMGFRHTMSEMTKEIGG